jgi:hypothetical protein
MTISMNHRQEALVHELFERVHARFPILVQGEDLRTSPDDPNHIWVYASARMNAQDESDVHDFAAEIEAEILEHYGYRISLMLLTEPLEETETV